MTPAILTQNLTKIYRRQVGLCALLSRRERPGVLAVDGISLEVAAGEIFGLLGPNGAGKTTFIKLLCTLLLPSSGSAQVCGYDVVREAHKVKHLVALVTSEERSFFWRLTGRQNLQFFAAIAQLPRQLANARIQELMELLDLGNASDVRFNEYSTGMRQKLAIARGLLSQAKVLFMDEPTKGLDPISAQALLRLIRQKVVDLMGSTIILTTHILRDVEQLCDRVALINKGKLIACGTLGQLRLSSRQHHRYRLRVKDLSDRCFEKLSGVPGIVKCSKISHIDGIADVALNLRKDSTALSETLRQVLQERCDILSCVLEEEPLEEVFTRLIHTEGIPSSSQEDPEPCLEQLLPS